MCELIQGVIAVLKLVAQIEDLRQNGFFVVIVIADNVLIENIVVLLTEVPQMDRVSLKQTER